MKPVELREKTVSELNVLLAENRQKQFDFRKRAAAGEEIKPHETRAARQDVARLLTLLHAYELVQAATGADEPAAREALQQNGWSPRRAAHQLFAQKLQQEENLDQETLAELLRGRAQDVLAYLPPPPSWTSDPALAQVPFRYDRARTAAQVAKRAAGPDTDGAKLRHCLRQMRAQRFTSGPLFRQAFQELLRETLAVHGKTLARLCTAAGGSLSLARSLFARLQQLRETTGAAEPEALDALERCAFHPPRAAKLLEERRKTPSRKEKKRPPREMPASPSQEPPAATPEVEQPNGSGERPAPRAGIPAAEAEKP